MTEHTEREALLHKLNQETGKMAWLDLQTFFAAGQVVFVEQGLDLIQIAAEFSCDNKTLLEPLIKARKMGVVKDALAQQWQADNTVLWTVVVAPWVLVQPIAAME